MAKSHSLFFVDPLYSRMAEDLHLGGISEWTRSGYLRAVRKLVDYCQASPDVVTEDQLRRFFLHMKNELNYALRALYDRFHIPNRHLSWQTGRLWKS
jgi:hypothetical protein